MVSIRKRAFCPLYYGSPGCWSSGGDPVEAWSPRCECGTAMPEDPALPTLSLGIETQAGLELEELFTISKMLSEQICLLDALWWMPSCSLLVTHVWCQTLASAHLPGSLIRRYCFCVAVASMKCIVDVFGGSWSFPP